MVRGFEQYTSPLTRSDKEIGVPILTKMLKWRKGHGVSIKNGEIREKMRAEGYPVGDAKVRALINYIRVNGLVERLVATSEGYYIAESAAELSDYCDSLREREAAIRAVRQALESQNTQSLFAL